MLFNSVQFLLFFPAVTLVYFLIPNNKMRNVLLLCASYFFYMCWNAQYALLMLLSTFVTYMSGILIERAKNEGKRGRAKVFVAISFTSNLLILFFFKYFDFALDNVNRVLGAFGGGRIDVLFDVILPVGISFYTFQALGYTVDAYRGDVKVTHNFLRYALFVSFFPQLVAGPIERSSNLLKQFEEKHVFDTKRVKNGLMLMLWGYFLKLVIADRCALLANQVYNNYTLYGSTELIVGTLMFAVQIYCDFSSYSIIAIGCAQVLGFSLMRNFDTPYFARSIAEFWRRWHISLSTWFRDYLYIPLGGNRKGAWRKNINLMVVFLVSGLWHGAAWGFIIWGAMNGIYQVVGAATKSMRLRIMNKIGIDANTAGHKLFQMFITFALTCASWVFFRANTAREALSIFKRIVFQINPWTLFDGTLFTLGLDAPDFFVALFAIAILIGVSASRYNKIEPLEVLERQNFPTQLLYCYTLLFIVLIFGIYGPGYDASAFIYFQF